MIIAGRVFMRLSPIIEFELAVQVYHRTNITSKTLVLDIVTH